MPMKLTDEALSLMSLAQIEWPTCWICLIKRVSQFRAVRAAHQQTTELSSIRTFRFGVT